MVHAQDATQPVARPPASPSVPPRADPARYAGLPQYIFGIHDSGGEAQMLAAYKPGWIVISVQVNPSDSTGDFATLAEQGLGVIVRLNNGYDGQGTLPDSTEYDTFARQCAEFVAQSRGVRVWVIGNEPNTARARPGHTGGAHDNSGEAITPEMYARCFNQCRRAIHEVPGHASDWVLPAAIAPFNTQTTYPANPNGDWIRYFSDVLLQIVLQGGKADALALHAYTHGTSSSHVTSDARGTGKFSGRHSHFRAYRDFMAAITPTMRHLPVLITAAAPLEPGWSAHNRDWIQMALAEINAWNADLANQPIQALCLFRWHAVPGEPPGWGMADKPQVVEDLSAALQNDYRVRWPMSPAVLDIAVQWLTPFQTPQRTLSGGERVYGHVSVRNAGARAWPVSGSRAVRLGLRWLNSRGQELPVELLTTSPFIDLPRDLLPGQTLDLDEFELVAPRLPGEYVCRLDLKQEGGGWFSTLGAPTVEQHFTVTGPEDAFEWLEGPVLVDDSLLTDSASIQTVKIRNLGKRSWAADGDASIQLGYHWHDEQGRQVELVRAPRPATCTVEVAPGEVASVNVELIAPPVIGDYTLQWVIGRGEAGTGLESSLSSQSVHVRLPTPEWAAEWMNELEIPEASRPNATLRGSLSVKNTGTQTWQAEGDRRVSLEYSWRDDHDTPVRGDFYHGSLSLSREVAPGESMQFDGLEIRVPIPRGNYKLSFGLVMQESLLPADAISPTLSLPVRVETDAPDYAADWLQTIDIPQGVMLTGQVISGRVALKNSGALAWQATGENSVQLGYRWLDRQGRPVPAPGAPGPLSPENSILPDETAIVPVGIHAPDTPGKYMLRWELTWGEAHEVTATTIPVQVNRPPLDWGAEFLEHDVPISLATGQRTTVELRVENTGRNVWPSKGEHPVFCLGRWLDLDGTPIAGAPEVTIPLESGIAVQAVAELTAEITAPPSAGDRMLQWDLCRKGAASFAEGGNPPLGILVKITDSPTPFNLWRAAASHNPLGARAAVDGDLATCWSSGESQSPGMWFQIDLGEARLIDGLAFRSGGLGYPSGYLLHISADGENWQTIATVAAGNDRDIIALFAPCPARFAQLELVATSPHEWRIAEIQVHTSPGWKATASANNQVAARAIDNSPATVWTTGDQLQKPNLWFQLDLGRPECVTGFMLHSPADEFPASYRLTIWNERAGGWQLIAERQENHVPVELAFAPVVTQYINLQLVESAERPLTICQVQVERAMTDWISPA